MRWQLLLLTLCACGGQAPSFERTGVLRPGGTMIVRNISGDIDAYAPRHDQPPDQYTIQSFSASRATIVHADAAVVYVTAASPGIHYLIRGAKDTTLILQTRSGTINVADFDGDVDARDERGDVKMLLPQYGNAWVEKGNLSVTVGSAGWPGTLHFVLQRGDAEIYVNATAPARVHLHTANGTIYTDFPLRGSSSGHSETIDAPINGGASRGIDVEVNNGSIRLLQLKPQV